MTILDVISKRLQHINRNNIIVVDNINLISRNINPSADAIIEHISYNTKHIYLKNSAKDPQSLANLILDIFINIKKTYVGTTIYIDDQPEELIEYIKVGFSDEEYKKRQPERYKGIAIQHIEGVGYVISVVDVCSDVVVNTYQPDDYMSRLDEYIVLGMAKQEKRYIRDWVAYHLRIGFDRIYLYDNNNTDGESYNEILADYIESGKVELVDIRGRIGIQNYTYNSCYYLLPYRWMAVIDIDEYIWFKETGRYNDIHKFIDSVEPKMDQTFFGIMLHWHCYASSGEDHPSDKPIYVANNVQLPRYARKDSRCEYIHDWCKSIYRSGYAVTLNEHFAWSHEVNSNDEGENICRQVDYNGVVTQKPFLVNISEEDFNNEDVFVKHFLLRNIDDFYKNKYLRGHAGADFGVGYDGWRFYQWFQNINYYTDISGTITKDEQTYLIKHGMKMNYTFHPDVFLYTYLQDKNRFINTVLEQNVVADSLLPQTNTFMHRIHIYSENMVDQPVDDDMPTNAYTDIDFMSKEITTFFEGGFYIGDTPTYIKQNIQEPIVIFLGAPLKYMVHEVSIEEQKRFADFFKVIFNPDSMRGLLRTALDHDMTIIPTNCIEYSSDIPEEFRGKLSEFMSSMGLGLPQYKITGNTMIMPYRQFLKLVKFNEEFNKRFDRVSNTQICEDLKSGTFNNYDAYINSVLSVIERPYYVWPS